jgi:undecaprenyl-diphosphatase
MNAFGSRLREWVHSEIMILVLLLVVAGGAACFIRIADWVRDREIQGFDEKVLRGLRSEADPAVPIGPWWVADVARNITALGSVPVLLLLVISVSGFLYLLGKRHAMGFLLVCVVGGVVLTIILKETFGRARPDLVPRLEAVSSASFPSGHSMMSAVVYLTLAVMLARIFASMRIRVYVICVAVTVSLLVGLSRMFLGVHYPSDVLAGWIVGFVWSISCWIAARILQRTGVLEGEEIQ